MSSLKSIGFSAILLIAILGGCRKQEGDTVLKGPYLGQTPPGTVPELFAPDVVSSPFWEHSGAVFTPDGNELFWSRAINEGREPRIVVIMHMRQENGLWTSPELAPFNFSNYTHINSISPDGKRLYLYSDEGGGWIVEKIGNDWDTPRLINLNNSDKPGRHINEVHETRNGNLYLSGPLYSMPKGRGIVRSRLADGKYQPYESLGAHVNFICDDPYPNHSPTVDPNEKFVIFVSRRPGGYTFQDLYISFRQIDDSWGPAINLGEKINTIGTGNSWPQLSPDGKYLFFTSRVKSYKENDIKDKKYSYAELVEIQDAILNGWGNIYWVSTSFIEEL
ncbi:PD40 domain-containing protein [bacterium]|nr:PD40 domain-containing protein [bacterium]